MADSRKNAWIIYFADRVVRLLRFPDLISTSILTLALLIADLLNPRNLKLRSRSSLGGTCDNQNWVIWNDEDLIKKKKITGMFWQNSLKALWSPISLIFLEMGEFFSFARFTKLCTMQKQTRYKTLLPSNRYESITRTCKSCSELDLAYNCQH